MSRESLLGDIITFRALFINCPVNISLTYPILAYSVAQSEEVICYRIIPFSDRMGHLNSPYNPFYRGTKMSRSVESKLN